MKETAIKANGQWQVRSGQDSPLIRTSQRQQLLQEAHCLPVGHERATFTLLEDEFGGRVFWQDSGEGTERPRRLWSTGTVEQACQRRVILARRLQARARKTQGATERPQHDGVLALVLTWLAATGTTYLTCKVLSDTTRVRTPAHSWHRLDKAHRIGAQIRACHDGDVLHACAASSPSLSP
jgi:hypothetical protein